MSKSLTAAAVQSFDDMVKQAYQGEGKLRRTVRVKTGIVGSSHRFTNVGRGIATPRIPQTDVVPMNIAYTNATATLTDWNAPEYTDVFDQQKVNFDERTALAEVVGGATARREDQLIIDAAAASGTTKKVLTAIGGAGSDLNSAKYREAKKLLDQSGVPQRNRHMVVHVNNLSAMLGDTTATSADFNTIRALVNGELSTWVGFETTTIEDRDEGGLDKTGAVRTGWAYHGGPMGALGHAVGKDHTTNIDWIAEKTSWLINGLFSGGSVGIDPLGIVEMEMTEA